MSLIPYYVRADPETARHIGADQELVLDSEAMPDGTTMIDIDMAHEALAWLISPLKRAEDAYQARLIADRNWPDHEINAHRAALSAMPIDDGLAAVTGWMREKLLPEAPGNFFLPERVVILSKAMSAISESQLRAELDFEAMDEGLVAPDGWLEEGEDIFSSYVLPALSKLQAFYQAAAREQQAVLVLYT